MEDNKNIGIWWLKHQLKTPAGRKIKGEIWWGVCKKTRNVAFAVFCNNTIHAMAPMIIQDTNIEEGKCFDGKSCLNIDCPYAESKTLIHAINKTNFKGINTDENLIKFFERIFKFIKKEFGEMDEKELTEIFVDNFERTTVTQSAFETRIRK